MAKVIISPGFGGRFWGADKHRFDAELIRIMEEKDNLVPGARGNPQKRKALDAQLKERLQELKIDCDPADLVIHELASGKRFKIEDYDGAEYIITEDDLDMVAP
jgi:hypothetical protein